MSLSPEQLRYASELVGAASTLRDAAAIWRAHHPQVRVLLVDALDMRDEVPALQMGKRRVYYSASNGHCWRITGDAQEASTLIFSEVS